ncbi:sensor histidine kinase [Amycolatopsis sp. NPDC059021]|uniref:sensor histidine kinase n=1 Tax=Amycolatopsis sp. NPDC059021 TaxID=3346704 RepID=UPI00366B42E8
MYRLNIWLRGHPWVRDLPLYALFVFMRPMSAPPGVPHAVLLIPYLFLLPLFWRRRYPRIAAALIIAGVIAQYSTDVWAFDRGRGDLALAVVLFTLVKRGDRRFAAVVAGCALALDIGWAVVWGVAAQNIPTAFLAGLPLHIAAWALGEFFRAREKLTAEEGARAELAASEEKAQARAAVAEERTRIARELHDVLAHSMSVIVLNAEGAKLIRHQDPESVDRTLDTISRTGRDALAELRRLLEVLHAGEAGRSPQPTVTELQALVDQVSTGGRQVDLVVTGEPAELPASAALQVYRIVQEALTNMIKHASADATGRVEVAFGPGGARREVRVEVTNSGGTERPAPALPSSGRGLTGMAQRVEMYHGKLDTGPTEDGGYRVSATLVLEDAA